MNRPILLAVQRISTVRRDALCHASRMTDRADQGFEFLPPAAAGLGHMFARPKWVAAVCVVALAGLGWLALGAIAVGHSTLAATIDAMCHGSFVAESLTARGAALVASMWTAMVLAMMLPSAAPMILTYAEIADTAARQDEPVVSPLVLAASYTAVWLGFAGVATLTQLMLIRAAPLDNGPAAASRLLSGAIFVGAGLYQFSSLKHACLTQCRSPFPFFFTNWATTARGVFRLGLKQGLFCVGCCWAIMLLMLTAGVMNVIWMAGLGIVMTMEKLGTGKWFSRAIGVALIAGGVTFVFSGLTEHWPGRAI
jgi:predicted metal-binding membrane protein